jgi:hypothetical protein
MKKDGLTERSTKNGNWMWAEKHALEKIRSSIEFKYAGSVLATYLALCECSSDERSNNFMASAFKISGKSCLSPRTVYDCLKELERIGLINITRGTKNSKVPNAYELLDCNHKE